MSKELELIRLLINGANEYEKETGNKNPTVYLSRNNLLIIEQALKRLEAIDNANPSEALEELKRIDWNITYLLSDCDINEEVSMNFNSIRDNKSCEVIKQALLKAQEPKHYLKWEDLEFKEKTSQIEVKLNKTLYTLSYVKRQYLDFVYLINNDSQIRLNSANDKQFFNDLRLERC